MTIRFLAFAALRDAVGFSEQKLSLPDGTTGLELWHSLREKHATLAKYSVPPMTAVNRRYVPAETTLRDGDEVAFIPPVSGG